MSFRKLSLSLLAGSLIFVGCTSDQSSSASTSANIPAQGTTTDVTGIQPGTDVTAAPTTDSSAAPLDTSGDRVIPLKDLPTKKGYPYAIKTKWPGLVKSPWAQDKQLVDVSGMEPGKPARCPHTGKIFIVP